MMQKYLVIFTVGPVQSFIAAARKTEDFWSGSYILSHMVAKAMEYLQTLDPDCEFVYPKRIKETGNGYRHVASLPNRFTAVVHKNGQDIGEVMQKTEQHTREAFFHLCQYAVDRVFDSLSQNDRDVLKKKAIRQAENYLEIYWVAEPYGDSESFTVIRNRAEERLGAMKNDKRFSGTVHFGLTCSVCKEHEALCLSEMDKNDRYGDLKRKMNETWNRRSSHYKSKNDEDETYNKSGRIKDNEFLCGICLAKRTAWDYFTEQNKSVAFFPRFKSVVEIGNRSYYAILLMDGDRMGERFSRGTKEVYGQISERLAHFSREEVPEIVESVRDARLVYAGGDDVLAFLPVDAALSIAHKLRFTFSDPKKGLDEKATACVGLIIGHKKTPLQGLLRAVRHLENLAKAYKNPVTGMEKNALALAVHTRSGEISQTVLPWEIESSDTISLMLDFIGLLNEKLSNNFIFNFMEAFRPLLHQDNEKYQKLRDRDMLKIELRRLLQRSVKEGKKIEGLDNHVEGLLKLHDAMRASQDFLHLLKILTFFTRSEGE